MKKFIKIFLTTFLIVFILVIIYGRIEMKKGQAKQNKEIWLSAKAYIEDKYTENITLKETVGHYDNVDTVWAYLTDKPYVTFAVRYLRAYSRFCDDFLERSLYWELSFPIKEIISTYHAEFEMRDYVILTAIGEKLLNFYEENGRPLSWLDKEEVAEIEQIATIERMTIILYYAEKTYNKEKVTIHQDVFQEILSDIAGLQFPINKIMFIVREHAKSKVTLDEMTYIFDGEDFVLEAP